MNNGTHTRLNEKTQPGKIAGWFFCIGFFAIGLINTFWGNDTGYGIFIALLSLLFLPPVNSLVKSKTGFTIPLIAKILLGIFVLWSALGVAELLDKIELMRKDL